MRKAVIILTFLFGTAAMCRAQQTIFNVPTTDVLDRGKAYVELDASFKPNSTPTVGRFSSFVPRIVVGVGSNVEVGLNMTGNVQPGADSTTLSPTVKWKFYKNEKSGVALMAGTNVYIPVRNRAYNIGSYSYLAGSKTINKTRLTAGAYVASRSVFSSNAVRAGGQFGFEQAINSQITVAADWITGKHASGYFTPGLIYKPHPKVTSYWSYSIGNTNARKGNNFFLFELGYNIN
ncbi:MAG: hypothetical protein QM785_16300 [Pyrinomonadaceae bacterium]